MSVKKSEGLVTHRGFPKRSKVFLLGVATAIVLHAASVHAGQIWDGGGINDNWTSPANWDSNTSPNWTLAGGISFGGGNRTSPVNNLTAATIVAGINLTNDGSTGKTAAFTLSGNSITLGGDIVTTAASATIADSIGFNLILNGDRVIVTNTRHSLTISGSIGQDATNRDLYNSGSGTLTLSAANSSFAGRFISVDGTTQVTKLADGGATSSIGAGTYAVLGYNSTATLEYIGTADSTTNRYFQIGYQSQPTFPGSAAIVNNGTGKLTFTAANFNSDAGGLITVARSLTLGGSYTGAANEITGIIQDHNTDGGGTVSLTKQGASTWKLSGANTFTGQVLSDAGTIQVTTLENNGTASSLGAGASSIRLGNNSTATLEYVGTTDSSSNKVVQIGTNTATNTGNAAILNNGTGSLTFTAANFNSTAGGAITVARSLTLGGSYTGAANEITGVIQNHNTAGGGTVSLTKQGASTWKLSGANTFTGQVLSDAGTIQVTTLENNGAASSLGAGTGPIRLGNDATATLEYIGAIDSSSNKVVQIGTNSATNTGSGAILNNGTGKLTFTAANFTAAVAGVTVGRSLTLGGSYAAAANEITGVIRDTNTAGGGVVSLAKEGASTWLLSGNNTYTGATSVNAGTLLLSGTNSGTGTVSVASAAAIGGTGSIAGNLVMGTGSTFYFNASSGLTVGGTVSFTTPGDFGVDDIIGLTSATPDGLYTIFSGTVNTTGLANLGSGNAYDLGSGKSAYFVPGSLQVQVVPEPGAMYIMAVGLAGVAVLRWRRLSP